MASLRLARIAGFSIIVSSGTLLAAIGVGGAGVTSAALFYLLSSTLAVAALFLLVDLLERTGTGERLPLVEVGLEPGEDTNLDDDETPLVGRAIPASLALLGLAFIACVLLVAGLPPLSGFVAKWALMAALLRPNGLAAAHDSAATPLAWWLFGLLLLSGLFATISLSRAGIRRFWSTPSSLPTRLRVAEGAPVLALILVCAWLTVNAERVLRYTRAAAESLHSPKAYIHAVMSTAPVPGLGRSSVDGEKAP